MKPPPIWPFLFILFLVLPQLCSSQEPRLTLPCGDIHVVSKPKKKWPTKLIADETKMTYKKTEAVIRCYSEQTAKEIIVAHQQLIKCYTWHWIKEDGERIKMYKIYFNIKDAELITKWAKTNL